MDRRFPFINPWLLRIFRKLFMEHITAGMPVRIESGRLKIPRTREIIASLLNLRFEGDV